MRAIAAGGAFLLISLIGSRTVLAQFDVGDAFAVYDPATGNLTFNEFANVGGVVVDTFGDYTLQAEAVQPIEDTIYESSASQAAWARFAEQGLTGGGYNAGNILPTNLSPTDLSNILVGAVITSSGVGTPTPLPICLDDGYCVAFVPPPPPPPPPPPLILPPRPSKQPDPVVVEPPPVVEETVEPEIPAQTPPLANPDVDASNCIPPINQGPVFVAVYLVDDVALQPPKSAAQVEGLRYISEADFLEIRENEPISSTVDAASFRLIEVDLDAIGRELCWNRVANMAVDRRGSDIDFFADLAGPIAYSDDAIIGPTGAEPVPTPEPSTLVLIAIGLGVLAQRRRRGR